VIELSEGRVVRDEAGGLYARDESTGEFAARLRAPAEPEPEPDADPDSGDTDGWGWSDLPPRRPADEGDAA
jgi:hypothetical protein